MSLEIVHVDYRNPDHADALVKLLNIYAVDPMGGGEPLPDAVRQNLPAALAEQPTAFSLIAFLNGQPVGLANCFHGFSTFAAKPLINIHDIIVVAEARGRGVAKALFSRIEAVAEAKGACKVTLEVLSGNGPAKALYSSLGYGDYALDPEAGTALFWQKRLAA
jgi:ribosomal protein S18 acetylase RimI-like enzyme